MILENTWQKCKCNRCGFQWSPREPWNITAEQRKKYLPKRCASCRSPYWNKPYVRNNTNRAPGSIGYQTALPLPAHNAGTVRSKRILTKGQREFEAPLHASAAVMRRLERRS